MFLDRFKVSLEHFTQSEIAAVTKATSITNQVETILKSNEVLTIEKLTGTGELGTATMGILDGFIKAINSPAVLALPATINSLLGGLGAQLTAAIHEGEPVEKGIHLWIHIFETIFHIQKKK